MCIRDRNTAAEEKTEEAKVAKVDGEEAGDDVRILYSQGCDLYKDKVENLAWDQDRISEAVITAENSDCLLYTSTIWVKISQSLQLVLTL